MTCIVGVVHKGRVYLGGDSAGVSGWTLTVRADPKVFRVGEFVLGFTSSFRMGQLLQHAFKPPALPKEPENLYKYMVTDFVDELRAMLKRGGFGSASDEKSHKGGTFLVGVRGRLFQIEDDYQVGEPIEDYDAVGCGSDIAKGALHVLKSAPPRPRVMAALWAAVANSAGVRGPFRVVSTEASCTPIG